MAQKELNETKNAEAERRRNFLNCQFRRQNNKENKDKQRRNREEQRNQYLVRRTERAHEINQNHLHFLMPLHTNTQNNDFSYCGKKEDSGFTSSSNSSSSSPSDMSYASS